MDRVCADVRMDWVVIRRVQLDVMAMSVWSMMTVASKKLALISDAVIHVLVLAEVNIVFGLNFEHRK